MRRPLERTGSPHLPYTAAIALILLLTASCTRTIEVPRESFDTVRDTGAEYLLVRTRSGDTWKVVEGWAVDSTLVVSLTKGPMEHDGHYPSPGSSHSVFIRHHPPMEIPFDEICWIDRVETDEAMSNAAAASVGVVAMLLVLMVWAGSQAPSSGY